MKKMNKIMKMIK